MKFALVSLLFHLLIVILRSMYFKLVSYVLAQYVSIECLHPPLVADSFSCATWFTFLISIWFIGIHRVANVPQNKRDSPIFADFGP